jgi:hypothetical protein
MKSKPKGAKYRNLTARSGVIYYQREVGGRRIRFSTATTDWDQAAAVRDLYEQRKGIGAAAFSTVEVPTFSEFSGRYLTEDTSHLAPTTRSDLDSYLREGGPLLGFFGGDRLDAITVPRLREWWNQEVILAGRSVKTGRAYLDVLSNVLGYAVELEVIEANPVPTFRQHVRRRQRTQRARSEAETRIRPIEDPWECETLLGATLPEGPEAFVYVLLGLDAGLRQGEALGLRWGAIGWGDDESDQRRHLLVDASRPRGGDLGPTKSGRAREVALSCRLHRALTAPCTASAGIRGLSALWWVASTPRTSALASGGGFSSGLELESVATRICGTPTRVASSPQAFKSDMCRPNSDTRTLR